MIEMFAAPWPAELVSTLPAVQYASGPERHFRRVAHVKVPDCRPGQMLLCTGSFEVTNGLQFLVELAACMAFTPSDQGTCGFEHMASLSAQSEPSGGRFVTRFTGFNVTPNQCPQFPNGGMHHAVWANSKAFRVPAGCFGDHYLAVVAYCGGLNTWPTSDEITVEQRCADVSATRIAM